MDNKINQRSDDSDVFEFFINGKKHQVKEKLPATTSLNDYIRGVAGLKGTKVMCKEAGCGCCAVTVTRPNKEGRAETLSINSCLCPLYSVDGWQISTVEGLGSNKAGLHPIQERLAKYNGTQCGYCSPGFVMSMYGLLHQKPEASQQDIEDAFDGHICRCTGYRSILDAMTSFGSDSRAPEKPIDIEDLNKHLCPKTGDLCKGNDKCHLDKGRLPRHLELDLPNTKWYRPLDLKSLISILQKEKESSVRLCFGNTSTGIFKNEGPYDAYVDLRAVSELYQFEENQDTVPIGAGTTLTKLIDCMEHLEYLNGFHYCRGIARHLKVVASVLVRNAGCIAGNLMIKHGHPEFPSDIFTLMEGVGAKVEIVDSADSSRRKVSLLEFLKVDMKGKVILTIELPKWTSNDNFRSFKITPRWQNAHAYVNAAFKISIDSASTIIDTPRIILGGISPNFVHASKTEAYLKGKKLGDATIRAAVKILSSELNPVVGKLSASTIYRKELGTHLLYKTLLELYSSTPASLKSGGESMERPLSTGLETFQQKKSLFPVTQALPKKTATFQTSGEAEYINDMPQSKHELAAAMVLSSVAIGTIKQVDTSEAEQVTGFVKYISASDIPKGGINNGFCPNFLFKDLTEEVFATKEVNYAGRLIGLVLADSEMAAKEGARKVKVTYENVKTPIVYIEDAIKHNAVFADKNLEKSYGDTTKALKKAALIVEGSVMERTQAHFYMENQIALAVPSEDGIDLYSTAQWADMVQQTVSQVLGKPMNYVNVSVPRLGGGFGGKTNNAAAISSAAAVAAEAVGRPVRLVVDLSDNMKYSSRRFGIYAKYKAGCDANGKLLAIELTVYVDSGVLPTPMTVDFLDLMGNGYKIPNFKTKVMHMKTNKAVAGPCRGPSSVPNSLIFETIMEHLAKEFGQHPILFKEPNLLDDEGNNFVDEPHCCTIKEGCAKIKQAIDNFKNKPEKITIKECWAQLKPLADISNRMKQVDAFNQANVWRKRGITMTSVKYPMPYGKVGFPCNVSVFAGDGTVTCIVGGVEMGQGLYMKVAQAVAMTLGVPLDDVKVRPNQNNVTPNSMVSGGSTSSEKTVASALAACDAINKRLKPIRQKYPGLKWRELVGKAMMSGVQLFENSLAGVTQGSVYNTYMAGAVESEIDVLTGEFQVKRVDIMADVGQSINPTVDIGQVQGAFVMGLGAYLTEDVIFDLNDGHVLNDGTWEYKPPTTKDIPIDWRVHFLKDSPNPLGILSSKATGEPAIGLSVGALLSIKQAVESVREQFKKDKTFIPPEAPFTVEKIQQATNITVDDLGIKNMPNTMLM